MKARIFEKLRGKAWIDKADQELSGGYRNLRHGERWLRADGSGREGHEVFPQRTRVADHVWMPELQRIRVDGRFMLFKSMNEEIVTAYSGYAHKSTMPSGD